MLPTTVPMAKQCCLGLRMLPSAAPIARQYNVCVCNAYVRPGLLDWPGQGLVALSLWLGGAGGLEAWGAGWLGGAGAGPGCLIENALKAATFQKHKKKHKKAREKHEKSRN